MSSKQYTRESIRDTLRASSEWHNAESGSRLWNIAFGLYNDAHPGGELYTKWGCSKCFAKVKEWLEQA
jgi:hypothetical protein